MKKLYLLLLVFLLLFIPATNAVTPYQLDHPIRELNGYTLREVFEEGKVYDYDDLTIIINRATLTVIGVNHIKVETVSSTSTILGTFNHEMLSSSDVYFIRYTTRRLNELSDYTAVRFNNDSQKQLSIYNDNDWKTSYTEINGIDGVDYSYLIQSQMIGFIVEYKDLIVINKSELGILSLTSEQIDMYYDYYLKAVQFEIDYYEAGQDPGEYQHIFKSILNGVKNLISEMGYVWQWLNAPIITSDMQDYSFNIDWSWDLIGVIRQIMNSAGILTLQIAFWVPSLAFGFMGIPVQISVLSLLFSNLIFLLLGWILVKSLLI